MQKVLFLLPFLVSLFHFGTLAQFEENYNSDTLFDGVNVYDKNIQLPDAQWIDNQTVVLEINALYNKLPDVQVAIFNITQTGQNADEAIRLSNERYKGFVNAVQHLGIDPSDIYLDMIAFAPIYEREVEKKAFSLRYNETPKGFEIQQNVHIKFTNSKTLPQLMTLATRYEIYDLVRVDYLVENHDVIYTDLRKRSISHMAKRITQLVDELGVEIDTAHRIVSERRNIVLPENCYTVYQVLASSSLGGKKAKVSNMRKSTTKIYNQVPYHSFDIVVNPTLVQPTVQFMYNLKIKFVAGNELKFSKKF